MTISNDYVAPKFSAGEVARLARITTDNLRDWRRRGLMRGIGTLGEDGRWSYSLHDIIGIWASEELIQRGRAGGLQTACAVSSMAVLREVERVYEGKASCDRYLIDINDGEKFIRSDTPCVNVEFVRAEVFDTDTLLARIPDHLKALLKQVVKK